MKKLNDIVNTIHPLAIHGSVDRNVMALCIDSREAGLGSLFIAINGVASDGHQYIDMAIHQGAVAVLCEAFPSSMTDKVTYIQVKQTAAVAGILADAFYDHPSSNMKLVGITGTNGKTTCATLLFQLFSRLGYTCGLISTVRNQIGSDVLPSTHTTPDAISLQRLLASMVEAKCTHVFMEVSSHAIHQHRIAGTIFTGACFTNITHDHLDYHGTFDEYIRVKKSFFDELPKTAFALSNADDKRGMVMLQNTKAVRKTYSLKTMADFKGKILENGLSGLVMNVQQDEIYFRLIGEFNAYNLLCVYGAALLLGENKDAVLQHLSVLPGAEGRFDSLTSPRDHVLGIVDYAHTPDALLNVLATINKLRKGNEALITVVGCGGDRDRQKRPVMGLVACEHSDKVIFTADNPRSEDAVAIIHEMEAGVAPHQRKKYMSIADRREAIRAACSMAAPHDILLVAGKGHEKYQEINGKRLPFDDKKVLEEMFELFEK